MLFRSIGCNHRGPFHRRHSAACSRADAYLGSNSRASDTGLSGPSPSATFAPMPTSAKDSRPALAALRMPPSRRAMSSRVASSRRAPMRSEEHTSELQSLMRNSYAVFCLKKQHKQKTQQQLNYTLSQYTK